MAKKHTATANVHVKNKSISSFINNEYREFAFYTIENRGIPNFYDSLTNVQRTILWNAPTEKTKTMSLVGAVFASNYHHGDTSIVNAINRMARPVLCGDNILEGSGFFGTVVCPEASQPRYNKVKLKKRYLDHVREYSYLNEIPQDDVMHRMYTSFPFGLVVGVNGIAIGYKSSVLPRKYEDIVSFIQKGSGSVVPYFAGFNGTVKRMKLKSGTNPASDKPAWLIEGSVEGDVVDKRVRIRSIPPVISYTNYIKKLNAILEAFDVKVQNNSREDVDIEIIMHRHSSDEAYDALIERIEKSVRVVFVESIVFSRDSQLVLYDKLENYLLDFRDELLRTVKKSTEYKIKETEFEINFLEIKLKFLAYMQAAKRSDSDVSGFLQPYPSKVISRLKSIPAYKITQEEINSTKAALQDQIDTLKNLNATLNSTVEQIKKIPAQMRSASTSFDRSVLLPSEINGISVLDAAEQPEPEAADNPTDETE